MRPTVTTSPSISELTHSFASTLAMMVKRPNGSSSKIEVLLPFPQRLLLVPCQR
jgi:hypothetical protein